MKRVGLLVPVIFFFFQNPCNGSAEQVKARIKNKNTITHKEGNDGFGSQFQNIIATVLYAELNNKKYVYTPFRTMEHNYDRDPNYLGKKEWLINFMGNFELNMQHIESRTEYKNFLDDHVEECSKSASLKKIKRIFRANKKKRRLF